MINTAEVAKYNMIEQQMRPWEILDGQVLAVINQIDRGDFVQDSYKGLAYADCQIPVCTGVTMFPPTIEGLGSGCGYITACLASLGEQVLGIDNNAEVLDLARQNTGKYSFENIEFQQKNVFECRYDLAYNVIAVTGSVRQVPENLKQALAIGGRMFIIVGDSPAMQALLITRASSNEWTTQSLFETDLPALTD